MTVSGAPEKFYHGQLRELICLMASDIRKVLIPVISRYKTFAHDSVGAFRYTADSAHTDLIREALRQAGEQFYGVAFDEQRRRLAQRVVSMADSETTAAFVEQINRALGVDIGGMMSRESLGDFFDAAVEENVALIRSLSEDYFDDVQRQVMDSIMRGDSVATLTRNLQRVTGVSYQRAALIARDQTLKISADITRKRQTASGITRFRWSDSQDARVSGNPAGKYPNAKVSCFAIARTDIGYGRGVYLWSRGASYGGENGLYPGRAHINCRCSAIPQIQGLDF